VAYKLFERGIIVLTVGIAASCGPRHFQQMPPAVVAPPTFHPGTVSEAHWSDGTKLQMVCLGGKSSEELGWKVDGSLIRLDEIFGKTGSYRSGAGPGKRVVVVLFNVSGKRIADAWAITSSPQIPVRLNGDPHFVMGGGEWNSERNSLRLDRGWIVPAGLSNADLEVGLGFGTFKPDLVWPAEKTKLQVRVLGVPVTKGGKTIGGIGRWLACNIKCEVPNTLFDKEWRIRLYGSNGAEIYTRDPGFASPFFDGPTHSTITLGAFVSPEQVKKVVIETRDFQWVKIPGLPMISNVHGFVTAGRKHHGPGRNDLNF